MSTAPIERQAMASSSFTALLNAFFISLGSLIPGSTSSITLVMSATGLINSLYLARNLLKKRERWQNVLRRVFLILVSLIVYGYELYFAILILIEPNNLGNFYTLTGLLLGVYAIGLVRAWQLLGARRYGLLGWLSPLHETNEKVQLSTQEDAKTSSNKSNDEISQPKQ